MGNKQFDKGWCKMKIMIYWLSVFLMMAVLGCDKKPTMVDPDSGYVYIGVDPNSAQVYFMALLPQINSMYEQSEELSAQNHWLRRSLDKCIEKLEAERGLEPIPLKYRLPLKGEPSLVDRYPQHPEPWFMPYEGSIAEPLPELRDIAMLKAMMGIHSVSVKMFILTTDDWIENFEKRMKRLEECLEK